MTSEDMPERAAPKKLVLSLVRRLNETRTRVQAISGEIGEQIKTAIEQKHLHAGALKLIAKLARMDPEKRDDFLRAYGLYRTYAEEAGLFGSAHVGDLVDDAEAGPVDAITVGDVAEAVTENVQKLVRELKTPPGAGEAAGTYTVNDVA